MSKTIVSREGWDATPPARPFTPRRRTVGVVLHHSGVRAAKPGPGTVRSFESYHMGVKKWRGIAYNWCVDADGIIYEGRGGGVVSGATRGWNSSTESICYTGWGGSEVPDRALDSIRWLVGDIQGRYGNNLWVKSHRDLGRTSCPGAFLANWLKEGMEVEQDRRPDNDLDEVKKYIADMGETVRRRPLSRRRRSRGEAVRLVQRHLNQLGFDCGAVDGIFGRMTAAGVKAFQRSAGLKVDGVVGKNTWARLFL